MTIMFPIFHKKPFPVAPVDARPVLFAEPGTWLAN